MWNGKPKFLIDHPGKIKEAFIYKGITYYFFEDIFSLPTIRGLQALDMYDEFNMRCTKEFLILFAKAQREILSNPKKLDLVKLATLTKFLEERLQMIPVPDQIYRIASVIFFDGTEDPLSYDRKAAAKKIEFWKQDPEILSFFLQTPLKTLIPLSNMPLLNLQSYSAGVELVNKTHLSEVLSVLSERGMKVEM